MTYKFVTSLLLAFSILFTTGCGGCRDENPAVAEKKKQEEEKPAAPPEPSNEEKLLAEIRDLLARS